MRRRMPDTCIARRTARTAEERRRVSSPLPAGAGWKQGPRPPAANPERNRDANDSVVSDGLLRGGGAGERTGSTDAGANGPGDGGQGFAHGDGRADQDVRGAGEVQSERCALPKSA